MEGITITNQFGLKVTIEKFIHSSSAQKHERANKGLIALGRVDAGCLIRGALVKINLPADSFEDKVIRIEAEHLPIRVANPGQSIGICLGKMTKKGIDLLLNQPTGRE